MSSATRTSRSATPHACNTYCCERLNPFLNFHRPCLYSTDVADLKKPGRYPSACTGPVTR